MVSGTLPRFPGSLPFASAVLALLVAGCATEAGTGPSAMPMSQSCQSIRGELNRLDARGVPARIDAQQSGKKLSAAHQAEVDRYNQLLNQYLGGRCHV